jgi:hypothetical protein
VASPWEAFSSRGIMRSNVYFVRSGSSWLLIDAASANCAKEIRQAAVSLFGADSRFDAGAG